MSVITADTIQTKSKSGRMTNVNVLSLFDGMSCGQIALDQLGIKVDKYFAAEIDPYAIKVAKANYPDMVHLGDVRDVTSDRLPKIDLLIGGSPCQGFSFAGKNLNFDDPRSKLFFEYVRLLKECQPKWFLLENVKMKKESEDIITEMLEVSPVEINSNLVSAQNRRRLYWTNIPFEGIPEDRGILLEDILEFGHVDRNKAHCIDANYWKGGNLKSYFEKNRRQLVFDREVNAPKILQRGGGTNKGGLKALDGKVPSLTSSFYEDNNHITHDDGATFRKLTPTECERLQTVPDGYTSHVSNTQRYKMLGNGWTVEVIKHLLSPLKNNHTV